MSAAARVRVARNTIVAAWECGRAPVADPASKAAQALEDRGLLQSPETTATLAELRALVDVSPAELSAARVKALAAAGARAVADSTHSRMCGCDLWPAECPNYRPGPWHTNTFIAGIPAVIGLWESLRTEVEGRELRRLRERVAELEAAAELEPSGVPVPPPGLSTTEAVGQLRDALGNGDAPSQVVSTADDVPVPVLLDETACASVLVTRYCEAVDTKWVHTGDWSEGGNWPLYREAHATGAVQPLTADEIRHGMGELTEVETVPATDPSELPAVVTTYAKQAATGVRPLIHPLDKGVRS
ncbi:hypothetical protein ACWDSL_41010 [Streptomyces sp. NPDC000941]